MIIYLNRENEDFNAPGIGAAPATARILRELASRIMDYDRVQTLRASNGNICCRVDYTTEPDLSEV